MKPNRVLLIIAVLSAILVASVGAWASTRAVAAFPLLSLVRALTTSTSTPTPPDTPTHMPTCTLSPTLTPSETPTITLTPTGTPPTATSTGTRTPTRTLTITYTATRPTPTGTPGPCFMPITEGFESGTLGIFHSEGFPGWSAVSDSTHTGAYAVLAPDVGYVSDQRL